MDVYKPSLMRNYTNQPNCWIRSTIDIPQVNQGKICSMNDVALAVKSIISHLPWPPIQASPSTFWEVIRDWGNTWMWDNLSIMGNFDWIAASIPDNSYVAVTDGSYIRSCIHISTPQHLSWSDTKAEGGLWAPSWNRPPMLVAIKESC